MDNNDTNIDVQDNPQEPEMPDELTHSDKMTGVFTEPGTTFTQTALFPPRTSDWLLPLLLVIVVSIIANIVLMSNSETSFLLKDKQMEQIKKQDVELQKKVKKGELTAEQAEQQSEAMRQGIEMMSGPIGMVISSVGIIVARFAFFFIFVLIFFLLAKYAFKGEGTFTSAMTAYGLPHYILAVQALVATILAVLLGKLFMDTSVASLISADKTTITGLLLSYIDPISIWFYTVLAIALAKMFKAESNTKYYILSFGVWIITGLIMFALGFNY
ncbi:MAG: hypothetical protein K8H86_03485 [Ignavibacteriaceae bacterium]|nr:hypothetical protein [Ignavibacteriaceae bacterium]